MRIMNEFERGIAPDQNITVTASAGVGKTYLLVTRIARLLLEGIRPDAILAITFTRKAANEIDERLMERLTAWATAPDDKLPELLRQAGVNANAAYIARARGLLETLSRKPQRVQMATFHAFCQDLLRRFPLDADVPPGFALLDNTAPLRDAAWDALYSDAAKDPGGTLACHLEALFDYTHSIHNTRSILDDFLRQRADWWAYTEDRSDAVAFATARARDLLRIENDEDPLPNYIARHTAQFSRFQALLARNNTATNTALALKLEQALAKQSKSENDLLDIVGGFLKKDGEPLSRKASKEQRRRLLDDEDEYLSLHASLSLVLQEALERRRALRYVELLTHVYQIGHSLIGHYQRIKRDRRLLDFADLEWRAYRLLTASENAHWVQYKLDQRFEHLLIDEFQDTNPTQWRLLLPLLEEFATDADRLRSAFIVGDAKQSIYRFRRADPGLLETAGQWLDERMRGERIPLDRSRRSAPAIIDFVNRIFLSPNIPPPIPNFTTHSTHRGAAWGRVEIWPLIPIDNIDTQTMHATWRNPLAQPRSVAVDDRHYLDGCRIAQHIRSTLSQNIAYDDSPKARALDYGDILILLRSRTHAPAYERALRDYNIPYIGIERGTLLETQEVKDIVALLTILRAPFDDIALASVLRSPIFSIGDDDLIALANCKEGRHWRTRLSSLAIGGDASKEIVRADSLLKNWHLASEYLPVHDLLDRIFCGGDIVARFAAAFPGHQRSTVRGNLTRMLSLALATDSGRYPSLGRFLRELEDLRAQDEGAPDIATIAMGGPTVRVMTVHASKGLEASLVYLADGTTSAQRDRAYDCVVRWPTGAPRPDYFGINARGDDMDAFHRGIAERQREAQIREEANLMYVALTRARNQLIVTGVAAKKTDTTNFYHQIATALDWKDTDNSWVYSQGDTTTASEHRLPPQVDIDTDIPTAPPTTFDAPVESPKNTAARLHGDAVHRLLQLSTPDADFAQSIRRLAAEYPEWRYPINLNAIAAEAERVIRGIDTQIYFNTAPDTQVFCELPVTFEREGEVVHGVIDRLIVDSARAIIIDYKTSRDIDAENMATHAHHHQPQLQRYAEAVSRCWPGREIIGVLIFSATGLTWRAPMTLGKRDTER